MEHTLAKWLLLTIATLTTGALVGFLIGLWIGKSSANKQNQQNIIPEDLSSYKNEVINYFKTTNQLVQKLNQDYADIEKHLNDSTHQLALNDQMHEELLAALHSGDTNIKRERLTPPKNNERPKDYADKTPGSVGTLNEKYNAKQTR